MASVFELVGAGLEGAFDPSAPERRSRIATNKARQRYYQGQEERYRNPPKKQPTLEELDDLQFNLDLDPEELANLDDTARKERDDLLSLIKSVRIQILGGGQPQTSGGAFGGQSPRTPAPATVQPASPSPAFSGLPGQGSRGTPAPAAVDGVREERDYPGVGNFFQSQGLRSSGFGGLPERGGKVAGDVAFGGGAGSGAGMALAGAVQRDVPSVLAGNAAEPEPMTQGAFEDTVRKMGNTVEARTYYDLWKGKKWPSPLLKN